MGGAFDYYKIGQALGRKNQMDKGLGLILSLGGPTVNDDREERRRQEQRQDKQFNYSMFARQQEAEADRADQARREQRADDIRYESWNREDAQAKAAREAAAADPLTAAKRTADFAKAQADIDGVQRAEAARVATQIVPGRDAGPFDAIPLDAGREYAAQKAAAAGNPFMVTALEEQERAVAEGIGKKQEAAAKTEADKIKNAPDDKDDAEQLKARLAAIEMRAGSPPFPLKPPALTPESKRHRDTMKARVPAQERAAVRFEERKTPEQRAQDRAASDAEKNRTNMEQARGRAISKVSAMLAKDIGFMELQMSKPDEARALFNERVAEETQNELRAIEELTKGAESMASVTPAPQTNPNDMFAIRDTPAGATPFPVTGAAPQPGPDMFAVAPLPRGGMGAAGGNAAPISPFSGNGRGGGVAYSQAESMQPTSPFPTEAQTRQAVADTERREAGMPKFRQDSEIAAGESALEAINYQNLAGRMAGEQANLGNLRDFPRVDPTTRAREALAAKTPEERLKAIEELKQHPERFVALGIDPQAVIAAMNF